MFAALGLGKKDLSKLAKIDIFAQQRISMRKY